MIPIVNKLAVQDGRFGFRLKLAHVCDAWTYDNDMMDQFTLYICRLSRMSLFTQYI